MNTFFQKMLMLVILLGLAISVPVKAANCAMSAAWSVFEANGTCDIGNIQLSNFNMVSTANPSGAALPASSITLTLNNSVAGQLTMQWNLGLSATGLGNFKDVYFTYNVTGLAGTKLNGDYLNFNATAIGGASASAASAVCLTGPIATCAPGDLYQTDVVNPPPVLASSMTFPSSMALWAGKDLLVSGASGGTATVSNMTNTYTYTTESQVPEPGTWSLISAGFIGIAMLRRRHT